MARPCGCTGECGCTYIGVNGVTVTGTGSSHDPGRIGLSSVLTGDACGSIVSCVGSNLGPGLSYSPISKQISAHVSSNSGNSIVFGSDGGLYSTGGSGGGTGGPTVDGLVTQTAKIVGGSYGVGNGMEPEGTIDPYTQGMNLPLLQMIHVPVRRTSEYALMVQGQRSLTFYNPSFTFETTDFMDMSMLRFYVYWPNGDPAAGHIGDGGYFGYGFPTSQGPILLSDVFAISMNRTVLYLEVKDIGSGAGDTPLPENTIGQLVKQIIKYGLTKSVIVGITFPATATAGDLTSIENGLAQLHTNGIAAAAAITTTEMASRITPTYMTAHYLTWAMIDYSLGDANAPTVKAYKDAGINVMLSNCAKQWHYNLTNDTTRFGTGGLKGILAIDPLYAAGVLTNYSYLRQVAEWGYGTPDYGRWGPNSNVLDGLRDKYRGFVLPGEAGKIVIEGTTLGPLDTNPSFIDTGYLILMGQQCPVPKNPVTSAYDSYDIEVGFIWNQLVSDHVRWMSVFFAVPEDRVLYEFRKTNSYTKGYQFQLSQNGNFTIERYDGIPYTADPAWQYTTTWASGWGTITPGVEYRVKVRVRPDRIILGRADQVEGGTNTRTFNAATGGGTTWRGPYFYLGRHFFSTSDSARVHWSNLSCIPA
jgi:hypothetical protein